MSRRKAVTILPAVPEIPRHEVLDTALRQAARTIAESFLTFCDLALEAIETKVHERYGYLSPADYFESRLGVSYRSARRWLAVAEGLRRLPDGERAQARTALAELGSHKAGTLARVLGREPWQPWVERAAATPAEALQAAVSAATDGTRVAGPAPGERFLRWLVANVPPEESDRVEAVLRAVMRVGNQVNPIAAFLTIIDIAAADLAAQGVFVEPDRADTSSAA